MEYTNYEINTGKVISEALEGETIIINMENGNYFSMNDTATIIWENLLAKNSTVYILNLLKNKYKDENGQIEKTVIDLLSSLERDGLISKSIDANNPNLTESEAIKKAFAAPKFDKYEDMQEMLLADPVHDVDAMGWPKPKEDK